MRKFGVFDIILIVLLVAGIGANVFIYGFYNKDDSGDKAKTPDKTATSTESPTDAKGGSGQSENTPPQNSASKPPAVPSMDSVVNTLVFRLDSTTVIVNGREFAIDGLGSAPFSHDGASMLPLRATYELLGGSIGYDEDTKYISATFLDTSLKIKPGETGAEVNGSFSTLAVAPVSKDGTTYVPARTVMEALGAELFWDGETQSITLEVPSKSLIDTSSLQPPSSSASAPAATPDAPPAQNSGFANYRGYASGETPSIADFFWFTEDVKWDGLPSGRTGLTDFGAISGYWKAYTETIPMFQGEETYLEWFNVEISGDKDRATLIYRTKGFFGSNMTTGIDYDLDFRDGDNLAGRFSDGRLNVGSLTDSGVEISITAFYTQDGNQYAVGEITWTSNEKEHIALVRP